MQRPVRTKTKFSDGRDVASPASVAYATVGHCRERSERQRTTVEERAAHWPKGEVRANARILPASGASDFGQRFVFPMFTSLLPSPLYNLNADECRKNFVIRRNIRKLYAPVCQKVIFSSAYKNMLDISLNTYSLEKSLPSKKHSKIIHASL